MQIKCSRCRRWLDFHKDFKTVENVCEDCKKKETVKNWKEAKDVPKPISEGA